MENNNDCDSIFIKAREMMKEHNFNEALPIIQLALECYQKNNHINMVFSSMLQKFEAKRLTERLDECNELLDEIEEFIQNHKIAESEDIELRKDYISYLIQKVLFYRDKLQYENANTILNKLFIMLENNSVPDPFL